MFKYSFWNVNKFISLETHYHTWFNIYTCLCDGMKYIEFILVIKFNVRYKIKEKKISKITYHLRKEGKYIYCPLTIDW